MIASEEYFKRQIALWGSDKQQALASKKIVIIGSGGLGCSLALALGTTGIGVVDLVDFDQVSLHNIHRQIAFRLEDEGVNKAQVVAKLLQEKSPFVEVEAFEMAFEAFAKLERSYDLILDATDNLSVRLAIDAYAKRHHTPWVYGSVEAFNGQVCFLESADFGVFGGGDHTPEGIAAPMVMSIASLQATLALRYLVGLPIPKDMLHYLYFSPEGELMTQKFGMPKV